MIETDRLLLAELTVDDAAFMLDLLNTPLWIQYVGDRHVQTLWDAQQYIINGVLKSYRQHGYGPYLVKLKTNGLPIGLCGLFKRDALDDPDIGFAFLPDYAGKGYGYEAASAVIPYAQKTFGITRIFGFTSPENQPSIRLLEKLGLRLEKRFMCTGDGKESLLFSLLLANL